jgi:hypothetical protein
MIQKQSIDGKASKLDNEITDKEHGSKAMKVFV